MNVCMYVYVCAYVCIMCMYVCVCMYYVLYVCMQIRFIIINNIN